MKEARMATPTPSKDSFRVPNSIIQGLTTSTPAELNRLSAFQMVVLLGLLTRVSPKSPHKEVTMRLSEILEIVEVSKQVAHAVNREWETGEGETTKRRYQCQRFSPRYLQQVHEALLALFDTSVVVQRLDRNRRHRFDERHTHLLDMFGYTYQRDGKVLDLDDPGNLPAGAKKVNVGSEERPVWRLHLQAENGGRYDRPCGIVFRLSTELVDELVGKQGTMGFTIMARKVFKLFKQYMRNPAVIRLIILILRQTGQDFSRGLRQLLDSLGFDPTHPVRAIDHLEQALTELQQLQVIAGFTVDSASDKLGVVRNTNWHREEAVCG
jgi:hypothetical protein